MAVTQTGYIIERQGNPMPNFYDDYQRFIKSLHIENFTFHDLRSTWAASAALDGVPMEQIRDVLGHSTATSLKSTTRKSILTIAKKHANMPKKPMLPM